MIGFAAAYLENIVNIVNNKEFKSFEDFKEWYETHHEHIVWDDESLRFTYQEEREKNATDLES